MTAESGSHYVRRALLLLDEAQRMARAAGAQAGYEGAPPDACPFVIDALRDQWHWGRTFGATERREERG